VLSGSYDGPVFLFPGDGSGGYKPAVKLATASGSELQLDNATSVSLYDWDKDGRPDLFVGTLSGPVWYVPNLGGGKVGTAVRLADPDGPMDSPDGGPCAVDWDGDGAVDLFLGADSGRLLYYRGAKGSAHPNFLRPVVVLKELTGLEAEPRPALPGRTLDWDLKRPMSRPKPSVADWDHDGKLDLLVGDFGLLEGLPREMSADDAKRYRALRDEQDVLKARSAKIAHDLSAAAAKKLGFAPGKRLTPEEALRLSTVYQELYGANAEMARIDRRLLEVFDAIGPLMPEVGYHGFVWLFRHKSS
jgi:hypothetical protein